MVYATWLTRNLVLFYFNTLQFPNIQMVGWANLKISVMFYVISLINVLFLVGNKIFHQALKCYTWLGVQGPIIVTLRCRDYIFWTNFSKFRPNYWWWIKKLNWIVLDLRKIMVVCFMYFCCRTVHFWEIFEKPFYS